MGAGKGRDRSKAKEYALTLEEEAKADLSEASAYYEGKQEGLGARFLASADKTLALIEQFPLMHAVVKYGVRRGQVRGFPYWVYYLVKGKRVEVIAVYRDRRDPRGWESRVRSKE